MAHAKEAKSGHLGNCVELIERRGHRDARLGGFIEKILPILSQAALALWQVVVATSAKHNVDAFGYLLRGDELLRIAETHQPQTNDEWKQDAGIGVVRSHRVTECDEKEAGVASVMRLVTTRPVRIPCGLPQPSDLRDRIPFWKAATLWTTHWGVPSSVQLPR